MFGNDGLLFIIILIIPIGIIVFFFMKKRHKSDTNSTPTKKKRDEVWRSIKYWLKQGDEQGKEIIDSYVAKRPQIDFAKWKKENKALWESMTEEQRKLKKREYKKEQREIYVVVFTTRDSKTGKEDKPRAVECEIVYAKTVAQHEKEVRNIVINGECDYATEAKWIDPLRIKDEEKLIKEEKRQQKREAKRQEKAKKEANKLKQKRIAQKIEDERNRQQAQQPTT